MTLKKKLFDNFFIFLPIAGGNGTSFEEAIIIEKDPTVSIYSLETEIIELLMKLQNATFRKAKQQYIDEEDVVYDVITILKKENESDIEIEEKFYFDITAYRRY